MAGGGAWVGVKGELSLASPPPEGAGWREIAWAGFLGGLASEVGVVRGRLGGEGRGDGRAERRESGRGWGRSGARGGGG